jgi:hypothetical protein
MNYYPAPPSGANEPASRSSSWRRGRPGGGDQRTSHLFWLTVFGLGCVSLVCVTWGASTALATKGGEKTLLASVLLPKLNNSYREPTAMPSRLPPVVEHLGGMELERPSIHFATAEPPHVASELALPSLFEMCDDPIVYVQPCTPQRGDSPMIANWKTLTLYSLLSAATVAFVPPPILAQVQDAAPDDLSKKISDLTKRVGNLEDKKPAGLDNETVIKALEAEFKKMETILLGELNRKLQGVSDDIKGLKTEMAAIKEEQVRRKIQIDQLAEEVLLLQKKKQVADNGPGVPLDKTSLDEIRSRLNAIQDAISKFGPSDRRLSMSPPNGAATNAGRVMLVNLYNDELLFIVNGASHRLPPGGSRLLENVPAGSLNYEVVSGIFGQVDRRLTSLAGGETFTLTASNSR